MVETGTRFVEVDAYVDLHTIGEKYGKSIDVGGNISPALILNGKPPEIEKSCREAIEASARLGGFILGSGCELPKNTPHENLEMMVRSAEKYGKYTRGLRSCAFSSFTERTVERRLRGSS